MLEQHFLRLCETLAPYVQFWRDEVIDFYPECLERYPEEWIADLERLPIEQLFAFERYREYSMLQSSSLRRYCDDMQSSAAFPLAPKPHTCTIRPTSYLRISGKKRHEIEIIATTIERLRGRRRIDHLVDFGGGIGNLARILAKYHHFPTTSIDIDANLQCTGRRRYESYRPPHAAPLNFHHADILALTQLPDCSPNTMSIGLHTCGALANAQLKLSVAAQLPLLLNFSCCYYKMSEADYYTSQFGQAHGIRLGSIARTLASHTPRHKQAAYAQWKRVKSYRYMIHLYLYHELGLTKRISLGNSTPELYRSAFEVYGSAQLERVGIKVEQTHLRALKEFHLDSHRQRLVQKMILANSIRSLAGRPLEALLLLDRALFLTENNYCVALEQFFDSTLSPRNIGILARRA